MSFNFSTFSGFLSSFVASSSRNAVARAAAVTMEAIEKRTMMSVAPQINYANFASLTNLVTNGYGADTTKTLQNALVLTDSTLTNQVRSVWYGQKMNLNGFHTEFKFQNGSLTSPNGFTIAFQNDGLSALGTGGTGLGAAGIDKAFAISFDPATRGTSTSTQTFATDDSGNVPEEADPTPLLNVSMNDPVDCTIDYNGSKLVISVYDESAQTGGTFTSYVDIPSYIGSSSAYVGFTAASGTAVARQTIANWDFTGYGKPTVANAAHALVSTVKGGGTTLSTLGADDNGESDLTYNWSMVSGPAGAKAPKFVTNGTNAAKNTAVKFYKAGKYVLQSTMTNSGGVSTVQNFTMDVAQKATSIKLAPHIQTLKQGSKQMFTATVLDQFGDAIAKTSPVYSVLNGGGTINKLTGAYIAPKKKGHVIIAANYAGLLGQVGVTVTA